MEITLKDLFKATLAHKKLLYRFIIVFTIAGLVMAFVTPKVWLVKSQMLPELSGEISASGSLSSLASLAGINLSEEGSFISPDVYNRVISSTPFVTALLDQKFRSDRFNEELTVYEFMREHHKPSLINLARGLPYQIMGLFKKKAESDTSATGFLRLSYRDNAVHEILKKNVNVDYDLRSGVVTISCTFQDPNIAAHIVDFSTKYLTEYLVDYRSSKHLVKLEFLNSQLEITGDAYRQSQEKLASFLDRNLDLTLNRAKIEFDNLQNENDLNFNIYSTLLNQREQVKLQLEENTLVFKEIEPVKIPTLRHRPKRLLTLMAFEVLGVIAFLGFIFFFKKPFNQA